MPANARKMHVAITVDGETFEFDLQPSTAKLLRSYATQVEIPVARYLGTVVKSHWSSVLDENEF